jgi:hypothetical protein
MKVSSRLLVVAGALAALAAVAIACASSNDRAFDQPTAATTPADPSEAGAPGAGFDKDATPTPPPVGTHDPETCAEAEASKSYVGCDYWPTVTANGVWAVFDYAVVVSNISSAPADVTVTGPNAVNQHVTVAPGALEKIYLPWVTSLKGPDMNYMGAIVDQLLSSVSAKGGAYHLVSTVPVVVYQFNALEYKGGGGYPGKDWTWYCDPANCYSYTNDASLLLPSTAWSKNYRVSGVAGWDDTATIPPLQVPSYFVVTAAENGTTVTVSLAPNAAIVGNDAGVPTTPSGGTLTLSLDAGDVVELLTPKGKAFDPSGTLVQADKPVQVIAGQICTYMPDWMHPACDHVEETVLPAEALGKEYVVTTPTKPTGGSGSHVVRFYGNRDGTTLTYVPVQPTGCPSTLQAGDVVQCGPITDDFVVDGTQEFGIATFMVGSSVYDKTGKDTRGDPSQSIFASTEQYRTSYLFLAPDDYDVSYAVITGPENAKPLVDGVPLTGYGSIGKGFGVWRPTLGIGKAGAHRLTSDAPVGLQVMGYGAFTSYQYPGGLDLKTIAPPPPPPH